jgi:hypothetical protein
VLRGGGFARGGLRLRGGSAGGGLGARGGRLGLLGFGGGLLVWLLLPLLLEFGLAAKNWRCIASWRKTEIWEGNLEFVPF